MDENPWKAGFKAGRLGLSLEVCPDYPEAEFWNWYCGFLSGRNRRLRLVSVEPEPSHAPVFLFSDKSV